MDLNALGWSSFFEAPAREFKGLQPARVSLVFRGGYEIWSPEGEFLAQVSGRFRHKVQNKSEYPVTGDFVMAETMPEESKALIHAILPRRTALSRTVAGRTTEQQVLAANVDDVFIAASLSTGLRARTLERYLTVIRDSGAQPILLLTKADLAADVPKALADAREIAGDTPVIPVSSLCAIGLAEVRSLVTPGRTAAILGPSGVGKSTLINVLLGDEALPTLPVREEDQKGRHTTTEREMVSIPGGGLIIDTPGLREIQLWEGEEGLQNAFEDIISLAAQCRFGDCQHETEPDCAVQAALASGDLPPERLASFKKLQREVSQFESNRDARAQAEQKRKSKQRSQELHGRLRAKGRIGPDSDP